AARVMRGRNAVMRGWLESKKRGGERGRECALLSMGEMHGRTLVEV
ncbi:unnamed protein product, partial [Neisseria lactamica Y92-1009]